MNILQRLVERRQALQAEIDAIIDVADGENRTTFTDVEEQELETLMAEVRDLDARITAIGEYDEATRRSGEIAARLANPHVRVGREPMTYERHESRRSFFLDLARATIQGDHAAQARLARHRQEIERELQPGGRLAALEADRQRAFRRWLDAHAEDGASIERRDVDRTDGTSAGDFVPPVWLLELYAEMPRAGRPFADAIRNIPLPAGTDSINVPKITTGTAVAPQTADNASVSEIDIVGNVAVAPVRTIAGQNDVALQLLDQSPIAFDEVVFADLESDYNAKVDAQLINGSGTAGQIKGILNATGIATITYTDATPTLPELWPKLAGAANAAGTNRKLPPTLMLVHWRRWMWAVAQLDSANRPMVVATQPVSAGPTNAIGVATELDPNGRVGYLIPGIPVVSDLNVPVDLGAGSNEDRIVVTRASDHLFFEGALRTRVLPEVLSGTLTVRLQVYSYCAATFERLPSATAVVAGTGLVTPTF